MHFIDQFNQSIYLPSFPKRIISLVPSQTELLFDLGLEEEVVGITKFCVHPQKWFKNKTRIGGTKDVDINKIKALQPDLIIANKEENVQAQIEQLQTIAPVWVSDISTLQEALQMIKMLGEITNKKQSAATIVQKVINGFHQLATIKQTLKTACYLIWRNPYITIGADTFIHDMLLKCGCTNVFGNQSRYPEISIPQIAAANPSIILLSSEPYPFKEKHIVELQSQLQTHNQELVSTKIILVDGEMFSWYGSRLLQSPSYFKTLFGQ